MLEKDMGSERLGVWDGISLAEMMGDADARLMMMITMMTDDGQSAYVCRCCNGLWRRGRYQVGLAQRWQARAAICSGTHGSSSCMSR
jgi:hypothetical protein